METKQIVNKECEILRENYLNLTRDKIGNEEKIGEHFERIARLEDRLIELRIERDQSSDPATPSKLDGDIESASEFIQAEMQRISELEGTIRSIEVMLEGIRRDYQANGCQGSLSFRI